MAPPEACEPDASPFASAFMGGFESAAYRRRDGVQLDIIAQSRHDEMAAGDYAMAAAHGLRTVRDALRWHRIETSAGRYDWSSALPMLRAAETAGVQVIWDLCHYGLPHDIDIWSGAFVDRFAGLAAAWARIVIGETGRPPILCPINEISFWAWNAGKRGGMYPGVQGSGGELKRQLVRASIAAIEAVRAVDGRTRFIQSEPLINVVARDPVRGRAMAVAEHEAQYEATDMLTGRREPELGGSPGYLDLVGLNYYHNNQFTRPYTTIPFGSHLYRPLPDLLAEVHARYGRPLFLSETGVEEANGPGWLRYVAGELRQARRAGIPVLGLCLYPVMDYPGWENSRHCRCGLIEVSPDWGGRSVNAAMARQLREEQALWQHDVSPAAPPAAPSQAASDHTAS